MRVGVAAVPWVRYWLVLGLERVCPDSVFWAVCGVNMLAAINTSTRGEQIGVEGRVIGDAPYCPVCAYAYDEEP